mmetsp:Transcript_1683/g.3604  ORF Transcript_1683/g.3604 Transcript_1683/m.3604 type:complete len:121 (-) Transcript_1683:360-722(-)|eukprot:CAMPEP_0204896652 /NCGR_PEP_ID=MMETSP1397-20131031/291_1 /ASSEMBLY_ACC=CAM_ASM_000891 /TAXON_ID=49980 /ORGANISM="Climacostomum Climacostomum virens, Strain Stock W-24" /LENGTH=120 /DNA_ID=CAMNT_0052064297 /DNA_START=116 /DNA_END=478 /DNA_ORIENTATION=-
MELAEIEEAVFVHRPYISEPLFYLQECFEEGAHHVPFSQEKFGVEICVGNEPEQRGSIPQLNVWASRNNFSTQSRPQTSVTSVRVEFHLLEDSTEYMESEYNLLDWSSRGSDLTDLGFQL